MYNAIHLDELDCNRKYIRKLLLEEFNYCCLYCDSPRDLTIDHLVPKSLGGSDGYYNLAIACRRCNRRKGNKPLADWLSQLGVKGSDVSEILVNRG